MYLLQGKSFRDEKRSKIGERQLLLALLSNFEKPVWGCILTPKRVSWFSLVIQYSWICDVHSVNVELHIFLIHSISDGWCVHSNGPFPSRRNGMQYMWRRVWGASEGLLWRIFHCYIWEHGLRSDGCGFVYRENTELPWHQSKFPASTFSTVVDQTPSDFVWYWTERSATTRYTRDYYRRVEL